MAGKEEYVNAKKILIRKQSRSGGMSLADLVMSEPQASTSQPESTSRDTQRNVDPGNQDPQRSASKQQQHNSRNTSRHDKSTIQEPHSSKSRHDHNNSGSPPKYYSKEPQRTINEPQPSTSKHYNDKRNTPRTHSQQTTPSRMERYNSAAVSVELPYFGDSDDKGSQTPEPTVFNRQQNNKEHEKQEIAVLPPIKSSTPRQEHPLSPAKSDHVTLPPIQPIREENHYPAKPYVMQTRQNHKATQDRAIPVHDQYATSRYHALPMSHSYDNAIPVSHSYNAVTHQTIPPLQLVNRNSYQGLYDGGLVVVNDLYNHRRQPYIYRSVSRSPSPSRYRSTRLPINRNYYGDGLEHYRKSRRRKKHKSRMTSRSSSGSRTNSGEPQKIEIDINVKHEYRSLSRKRKRTPSDSGSSSSSFRTRESRGRSRERREHGRSRLKSKSRKAPRHKSRGRSKHRRFRDISSSSEEPEYDYPPPSRRRHESRKRKLKSRGRSRQDPLRGKREVPNNHYKSRKKPVSNSKYPKKFNDMSREDMQKAIEELEELADHKLNTLTGSVTPRVDNMVMDERSRAKYKRDLDSLMDY